MIRRQQIVDAFSETVGESKAERVVQSAAKETGVRDKSTLAKDEALEIATWLANADEVDSLVRVSANTVKTQIRVGELAS